MAAAALDLSLPRLAGWRPPCENANVVLVLAIAAAGADRHFEAIVLAHEPVLSRMAFKLCRNEGDAHDLVQDTFEPQARPARSGEQRGRVAGHHPAQPLHRPVPPEAVRATIRADRRRADRGHGAGPRAGVGPHHLRRGRGRARKGRLRISTRFTSSPRAKGARTRRSRSSSVSPKATVGTRLIRARRKLRELLVGRSQEETT